MIDAPVSRMSSGDSALTVAFVPTGMNWGVSTTPWVSVRRPAVPASSRRPAPTSTVNEAAPPPVPADDVEHDRQDTEIRSIVVIGCKTSGLAG